MAYQVYAELNFDGGLPIIVQADKRVFEKYENARWAADYILQIPSKSSWFVSKIIIKEVLK